MIVADTNVLSELMRPAPEPAVVTWSRDQDPRELFTTAVTVAEIRYGIRRLPPGRRREELATAGDDVFAAFADRILAFDADAAAHYASIVSARETAGHPIDGFDAQIAAICRAGHAVLATRNVKDFADTGVDLVDPWSRS